MFLKSGKAIAREINGLIDSDSKASKTVRLAVAFWGAGADDKLLGACKIVCDLESGACNPAVIRKLLARGNCEVRRCKGLHAKVVIGSAGAVVSSANMSTNGLGAEGSRASGTIEAGCFVSAALTDYCKIVEWFDGIWSKAKQIEEVDLVKAQEKWDLRNRGISRAPLTELSSDSLPRDLDPSSLLQRKIDATSRLRAVQPDVFNWFKVLLPDVESRRLGKIASWTCHLILNRAGVQLEHSAGAGEESGPATNQWIVGKFGTKARSDTEAKIEKVLRKIIQDTSFFSEDIRRAADQVLIAPPWTDGF